MDVKELSIFWFRRDLRLEDNHGLFQALRNSTAVLPIFIFDLNILDELSRKDARVGFIHQTLSDLKLRLKDYQSDLRVFYGEPAEVWKKLILSLPIKKVYTNHDYEPYAKSRDQKVEQILNAQGITFHSYKDHVLFERQEVLSNADKAYTVFTPYKRKWLPKFEQIYLHTDTGSKSMYPSEDSLKKLHQVPFEPILSLTEIGFEPSEIGIPSKVVSQKIIAEYGERRNFPGLSDSTSRLGIHFRFGTISIRKKAIRAYSLSEVYLSELIWRDFYAQILDNFPQVVDRAFKPQYDLIPWRENEEEFHAWCSGQTGYPIVDAGMRELNATGYMHNRVRMITASFLTKHLLMDWRLGEAYFAEKLLDFDLASNNGGWQWASGSGTDAAPYFRIFNPAAQMEKFDKDLKYIKKWVPEYGTNQYVSPIVDHKFARARCLETYKKVLQSN